MAGDAILRIEETGRAARIHTLRGEVTIGRRAGNGIVIDNPQVSGRHARIRPSDEGPILEDLDSTNRTRVNGREILRVVLRDGDLIEIGPAARLRVSLPATVGAGGALSCGPAAPQPPPGDAGSSGRRAALVEPEEVPTLRVPRGVPRQEGAAVPGGRAPRRRLLMAVNLIGWPLLAAIGYFAFVRQPVQPAGGGPARSATDTPAPEPATDRISPEQEQALLDRLRPDERAAFGLATYYMKVARAPQALPVFTRLADEHPGETVLEWWRSRAAAKVDAEVREALDEGERAYSGLRFEEAAAAFRRVLDLTGDGDPRHAAAANRLAAIGKLQSGTGG